MLCVKCSYFEDKEKTRDYRPTDNDLQKSYKTSRYTDMKNRNTYISQVISSSYHIAHHHLSVILFKEEQ